MGDQPKILAFAGSTRSDSLNKKLVRIAARGAERAGAVTTLLDLRDFPLPLFDGDLEVDSGQPDAARKLRQVFAEHDALLISSPEYNSSISGVLKNTIDWLSRRTGPEDPPLAAFAGKTAVLMSASPGGLGGLRGLVHLRAILGNIRVLVLPDQRAVPQAHRAFDENGELTDPKLRAAIEGLGEKLARVARKLGAGSD